MAQEFDPKDPRTWGPSPLRPQTVVTISAGTDDLVRFIATGTERGMPFTVNLSFTPAQAEQLVAELRRAIRMLEAG